MPSVLTPPPEGWPLARAAERMGLPLEEGAARGLESWLDLLAAWNARVDLTAARSADELVDLMVADALVLAGKVPDGCQVIDVGAGAGAPGLALAILRPDLRVTLVEPLAKRAAFLRTVLGTLGLVPPRVTLEAAKGGPVAAAHPHAWDVALARATLAPTRWLDLASDLLQARGSAWVFLAREAPVAHPAYTRAEEVAYAWPLTAALRRLVRYERRVG